MSLPSDTAAQISRLLALLPAELSPLLKQIAQIAINTASLHRTLSEYVERIDSVPMFYDLYASDKYAKVQANPDMYLVPENAAPVFLWDLVDKQTAEKTFSKCVETLMCALTSFSAYSTKHGKENPTRMKDLKNILMAIAIIPTLAHQVKASISPALSIKVSEVIRILSTSVDRSQRPEFTKAFTDFLNLYASSHVPLELPSYYNGPNLLAVPSQVRHRLFSLMVDAVYNPANRGKLMTRGIQTATSYLWIAHGDVDMVAIARSAEKTAPEEIKKEMIRLEAATQESHLVPVSRPVADTEAGRKEAELDEAALESFRSSSEMMRDRPICADYVFTELNQRLAQRETTKVEDYCLNGPAMVNWIINAYDTILFFYNTTGRYQYHREEYIN